MPERTQRLLGEAGRFLTVGLVATLVALVLFNLLVHGFSATWTAPLNEQPALAYVLANTVGMVISFRGSRDWAFRDRPSRHADGGVAAFVAINLATMLIPITCLMISRGLGFDDPVSDNLAANVLGLGSANAARFVLFRRFVFRSAIVPGPGVQPALSEPTAGSTCGPARPPGPGATAG